MKNKKQKNTRTYVFMNQIAEIIGKNGISSYHEDKIRKTVSFTYWENTVSFPVLIKLSELFGTTDITFSGDTEEYWLSEITSDTSSSGEFYAADVKFPE